MLANSKMLRRFLHELRKSKRIRLDGGASGGRRYEGARDTSIAAPNQALEGTTGRISPIFQIKE